MYLVSVIPLTKIPLSSPQTLDYFSNRKISIGGIVMISLNNRKLLAIVISCASVSQKKQQIKHSAFQLKPIDQIINENTVIPRHRIKLAIWTSAYFYASLGLVTKTLLPKSFSRPTKKFLKELSTALPSADIKKLKVQKPILYWNSNDKNDATKIKYYSKEIGLALKRGGFVLFLVPELYKINYFKKKIPSLDNKNCIIGTRSALSFPAQNLKLIIVDDEESPFYKSFDQQPHINAREIAVKLAEFTNAKIILSSNLPSTESFWKAKNNHFVLIKSSPPHSPQYAPQIIDMKQELKDGNYSILSKKLQEKLHDILLKKNQRAVLFINRKGLNTGLLCRDCGHIIKCPNCDVPMVYHIDTDKSTTKNYQLLCHHCGQKGKAPSLCPECGSYKIKFIGTGTQRVGEELIKLNIASREQISRLDLDITPKFQQQEKVFSNFLSKKFRILICTQLGLKTELLPKVELTAIITADSMFSLPDFRMREYFIHIVDKLWTISKTTFLLQTYIAGVNILENVFNDFLMSEIKNRKELFLPPFSQIIKLSYEHKNPQKAESEAILLKNKLQTQSNNLKITALDLQILGPAPGFISRIKNRYIWQIMLKSKIDNILLRNKILRIVPSDWRIDVDPVGII